LLRFSFVADGGVRERYAGGYGGSAEFGRFVRQTVVGYTFEPE